MWQYGRKIIDAFFKSYHFEGIGEGADGVRIILSQPYISDQYFFIDPIIKMKRPAVEVLAYYYELLK